MRLWAVVLFGSGNAAPFSKPDGEQGSVESDCAKVTSWAGLELSLRPYRPIVDRIHSVANSDLNGASMIIGNEEKLEIMNPWKEEGKEEEEEEGEAEGRRR